MAEIALKRTFMGLLPATPLDVDAIRRVKIGDVITCKFSRVRNPRFHRKFFAMLNLAFQCWDGTAQESKSEGGRLGLSLRGYLIALGISENAAKDFTGGFFEHRRKLKTDMPDNPGKSFPAFRAWVTVEAGYYITVATPAGTAKEPASISFASMDDDDFAVFYKAVFNVCWNFFLSGSFDTHEQAEAAAEQFFNFA